MIQICQQCKKEFNKERKQKYCSAACFGKTRCKNFLKKCEFCDTIFKSDPNKKRKYCDKKCAGKARRAERVTGICEWCGVEFKYRSCLSNVKFCTKSCAGKAKRSREIRECEVCGTKFYPSKKTSRFCSPECHYSRYPRQGYKQISLSNLSNDDKNMFSSMFKNKNSVHEHRFVMAKHIGRPLESHEIVHHKNGDKRDNRIENLELLEKKQHHTGVGDKVYQELQEMKARNAELEQKLAQLENIS